MKTFLDMNVCLYKLYKCVHDRVRRFYTSAGLTYGHVAFSSISSTILCEKHVRRRDTRTQYGTKEETGISPGVERVREIGERERKRDRHHGLHFVSLLLCLQSTHLNENILIFILSHKKRILGAWGIPQETLDTSRFAKQEHTGFSNLGQRVNFLWVVGSLALCRHPLSSKCSVNF